MNLKNREQATGYDLEELYFEKLNRELINKMKGQKPQEAAPPPGQAGDNVIRFPTKSAQQDKKAA